MFLMTSCIVGVKSYMEVSSETSDAQRIIHFVAPVECSVRISIGPQKVLHTAESKCIVELENTILDTFYAEWISI